MDIIDLLEPITLENIYELKPGEWIWDNKYAIKRAHKRSLELETTIEPIGFRQIHVLDLKDFGPLFSNRPFMLSECHTLKFEPVYPYFTKNRFYKFKKEYKL